MSSKKKTQKTGLFWIRWLLTVLFFTASIHYLTSAGYVSALFGMLVVAFIIPVQSWQRTMSRLVTGKIKPVAAIIMALICFVTAPVSETEAINKQSHPTGDSVITEESVKAEEDEKAEEPTVDNSTFSIHFIDVGQADAALVECDGHYMLIDGGNKEDSDRIYTVLKNAGAVKLDIVVGTHAHEDHIGGLPGAFNYASADITLCPVTSYNSQAFEDFAYYVDQKGGGIVIPSVGDTYSLGSAKVTILGVNAADDTNDTSIILKIQYGNTSFLFTGDAERDGEQEVLNSGYDLSATVLKVGHHGSETSTTYPFLHEIMPQYAVISVGLNNSYGHPEEDTLSRLWDADVEVYRTDLQGDIKCTSDGETVTFSVAKNADAEEEDEGTMVWILQSGKKYHSYAECGNMKNPAQVTEQEAEDRGYERCKKCW